MTVQDICRMAFQRISQPPVGTEKGMIRMPLIPVRAGQCSDAIFIQLLDALLFNLRAAIPQPAQHRFKSLLIQSLAECHRKPSDPTAARQNPGAPTAAAGPPAVGSAIVPSMVPGNKKKREMISVIRPRRRPRTFESGTGLDRSPTGLPRLRDLRPLISPSHLGTALSL